MNRFGPTSSQPIVVTWVRRLTLATCTAAMLGLLTAPTATAQEPADRPVTTAASPYATPLKALGGRCLAQYLAAHQVGVLGGSGV